MPAKGRQTEHKAVVLYEDSGYETYIPPKAKYREQDVFGLFDVLAFGHGQLVGCQVKTNRSDGITAWADEARLFDEHLEDVRTEFLVRFEGEGWKLYRPTADGFHVAYDGREVGQTPAPELREVLIP